MGNKKELSVQEQFEKALEKITSAVITSNGEHLIRLSSYLPSTLGIDFLCTKEFFQTCLKPCELSNNHETIVECIFKIIKHYSAELEKNETNAVATEFSCCLFFQYGSLEKMKLMGYKVIVKDTPTVIFLL